jgi:microcystin degradation protein MlrC
LTSIPSQCTLIEPCRSIYALLQELETRYTVALSFAPGFPMADVEACGMSLCGYGADPGLLETAMAALGQRIVDAEKEFVLELFPPEEAVRRAMQTGRVGRPTVLADTQDNPGAGGNGDTTGLLGTMLAMQPRDAVLGMIIDPQAAQRAHAVGMHNCAEFSIGGVSGVPGIAPVRGRFTVECVGDGQVTGTGPFYRGMRMHLGPMAALQSEAAPGVRVVLGTTKCQTADQEMFRHVGIEPKRMRIVAVKSSVHFRADFQPMAREVLVVKAPGPALADPADFAWTRLRKGLRLKPLGPCFPQDLRPPPASRLELP